MSDPWTILGFLRRRISMSLMKVLPEGAQLYECNCTLASLLIGIIYKPL